MGANSGLVGYLRIQLGLDTAELNTTATAAERRFDQLEARISKAMRGATGAVASMAGVFAGLGAGISAGALGALVSKGLEYAASLKDISQQLGVTTTDLQAYRYAAQQTGVSQDTMDKSLAKLSLTMGQAREGAKGPVEAFRELSGILGKDVLKNAATAGDAIPLIAEALAKIPDPARRAALETKLFGQAGQQLDGMLSGGGDQINNLRDAAEDLGIVLSEDQIQKANETAGKIDALKRVLEANIASAVADNAKAITDFVTALEGLIGKIPVAIQLLGAFASRAQAVAGMANIAYGTVTGNGSVVAQGEALKMAGQGRLAAMAGADKDAEIRARLAKQGVEWNFKLSSLKDLSGKRASTGAGAGVVQSEANAAARKAAAEQRKREAEAKRAAAAQARQEKKDRQDERRYQGELARAQDDLLSVQLDMTVEASDRLAIQKEMLAHESAATIEAIRTDEHIEQAQKNKLIEVQKQIEAAKGARLDMEAREEVARRELQSVQARMDNESDILKAQSSLARTTAERRDIELKILALQFEQLRLAQKAIINSSKSSDQDKADAWDRLKTLNTLEGLSAQGIWKQNQNPLEQLADGVPKSAAEMNEALQGVAANGIQSITDGLADAATDAKSLADVFNNVANEIIAALARIAIKKAVVGALGSLLGLTGDNLGAWASASLKSSGDILDAALNKTPSFDIAGARASGGPVIGGRTYLVGERGPELFTTPHSGQVVANDDIGTGGRPTVVELAVGAGQMFEPTVTAISGNVSVRTVSAAQRTTATRARQRYGSGR